MKRIALPCIKNSCRSQITEALCRHLGGDRFTCYSAGSDPIEKDDDAYWMTLLQIEDNMRTLLEE